MSRGIKKHEKAYIVRMMGHKPFDIVGVSEIVPLAVLLGVVEHDDRGDEVDDLAGRQQMQVASAVPATIAVHPVELELALGWCAHLVRVVALEGARGQAQVHRSAAQVHADRTFLLVVLHLPRAATNAKIHMLLHIAPQQTPPSPSPSL